VSEEFYESLRVLEIWTDPDEPVFENVGVTFRVYGLHDLSEVYVEGDRREYTTHVKKGDPPKDVLDGLIKIVKAAEDRVWEEMEDKPWNPRRTNYLFHKYLIEEMFPDQVEEERLRRCGKNTKKQ